MNNFFDLNHDFVFITTIYNPGIKFKSKLQICYKKDVL